MGGRRTREDGGGRRRSGEREGKRTEAIERQRERMVKEMMMMCVFIYIYIYIFFFFNLGKITIYYPKVYS